MVKELKLVRDKNKIKNFLLTMNRTASILDEQYYFYGQGYTIMGCYYTISNNPKSKTIRIKYEDIVYKLFVDVIYTEQYEELINDIIKEIHNAFEYKIYNFYDKGD